MRRTFKFLFRGTATRSKLAEMQEHIQTLQPQTSPGILTNRTTRGVLRKPNPATAHIGGSTSGPPRWQ